MSRVVLVLPGGLEAVRATALGRSAGFTEAGPAVVIAVAPLASTGGLALAMRTLPTGTAHAVRVGVGAVLTVGSAVVPGAETLTVARGVRLLLIVAGVVGLEPAR